MTLTTRGRRHPSIDTQGRHVQSQFLLPNDQPGGMRAAARDPIEFYLVTRRLIPHWFCYSTPTLKL